MSDRTTSRGPFPIFRVISSNPSGGHEVLMVFHLNTFGLVPVVAPATPPRLSSSLYLHRLATPEVLRYRQLLSGVSTH